VPTSIWATKNQKELNVSVNKKLANKLRLEGI